MHEKPPVPAGLRSSPGFCSPSRPLHDLGYAAGLTLLPWAVRAGGNTLGNFLIAMGYLGWGTENNLGRLLAEDIPAVSLASLKALVAAVVMGILAIVFGQPLAVPLRVVPSIVASGAFSLGLSLALFYTAMRHIGAGRTGLISSTSSFWGVTAALLVLGQALTFKVIGAGLLMVVGLALFAWESVR